MSNVCRLCLKITSDPLDSLEMEMENFGKLITLVIPEINLASFESPTICGDCSDSLWNAYNFKTNCLSTEERLKEYLVNGKKINLVDIFIKTPAHVECVKEESNVNENESNDDSISDLNNSIKNIDDSIDELLNESPKKKGTFKFCDLCNKNYSSRIYLQHLHIHTGFKHNCSQCDRGFTTRSEMRRHKAKDHKETLMHKCASCSKVFAFKSTLERHVKKHNEILECDVCGFKTITKYRLTEHIRTHTGEKPYKCDSCDKSFSQSSTLHTHIKMIHSMEKPFICEVCGKSFPVKGSYTNHMLNNHSNREKTYVCTYCDKAFVFESKLISHVRRHTGEKKYVCHFCSKRFVDTQGLKKHLRIHTGEKPYECPLCSKRFTQNYNKTIHLKSCSRRYQEVK